MKIALINPNANKQTTQMMVAIARATDPAMQVDGVTAHRGPMMIQDQAALAASAGEVAALAASVAAYDGVIVSAFGDPGVALLRTQMRGPVVGIGAAAALAAKAQGQPFAVVTTTPGLVPSIDALMRVHCGAVPFLGCFVTKGDPVAVMACPNGLDAALHAQITRAAQAGASQVIIGGGPLGGAAQRLAARSPVALINPISAAMVEMRAACGGRS